MGPAGVAIDMCEIEIQVKNGNDLQVFGDRRAHPAFFCKELEKNWKKITHNEKTVCISGESGHYENDEKLGRYRSWTWDKIKTKKGCHGYFLGCNVKGFAKKAKK